MIQHSKIIWGLENLNLGKSHWKKLSTASLDSHRPPRGVSPQTPVKMTGFPGPLFSEQACPVGKEDPAKFPNHATLSHNLLSVSSDIQGKVIRKRLTCVGLNQPCGQAQRSPQVPLPLVPVLWGLFRTLSHKVTSLVLFEAGPPGPEEGMVWELYPSPWGLLCQPQAQWASLISVGALLPASMPSDPRLQLCCLVRYAFILHWCLLSPLVSSAQECLLPHTPFFQAVVKVFFFFLPWIPQYLWQLL